MSEWVLDKTIEEILNLKDNEFLEMLGGVIQTRQKCALLSLETLRKALKGGDENERY